MTVSSLVAAVREGLAEVADPGWVARFVADHPALSPLSRREALKHIGG